MNPTFDSVRRSRDPVHFTMEINGRPQYFFWDGSLLQIMKRDGVLFPYNGVHQGNHSVKILDDETFKMEQVRRNNVSSQHDEDPSLRLWG